MTPLSIYRLGIWLPLIVPTAVALLVHKARVPVPPVMQEVVVIQLSSLLYGGVPYAALALWATWWVGRHSEPEIRRLMFRAPLLMVGVFVAFALVTGFVVGAPRQFAAVAALGAVVIIPLGYAYVAVVMLLRRMLGPREGIANAAPQA